MRCLLRTKLLARTTSATTKTIRQPSSTMYNDGSVEFGTATSLKQHATKVEPLDDVSTAGGGSPRKISRSENEGSRTNGSKILRLLPRTTAATARTCADLITTNTGAVLALPTDTVYGLACLSSDDAAINRIYSIKGRKLDKPLAVCVGRVDVISTIAHAKHLPPALLGRLLPGPVTVVLERSAGLSKIVNPDNQLVGVRIVPTDFMREFFAAMEDILHAKQRPVIDAIIAFTSANRSGEASTVNVNEFRHLWDSVDLIVNDNIAAHDTFEEKAPDRQGSTVVDLSEPGWYKVIRQGTNCAETVKTIEEFGIKSFL